MNAQTVQEALNLALKDLEAWKAAALAAQAERDALAAQFAALHKLHSDLTNADMVCDEDESHIGYVIENDQIDEMERLLNYPQQFLVEIKAQAVLSFAREIYDAGEISFSAADFVRTQSVHCAESIRRGEV